MWFHGSEMPGPARDAADHHRHHGDDQHHGGDGSAPRRVGRAAGVSQPTPQRQRRGHLVTGLLGEAQRQSWRRNRQRIGARAATRGRGDAWQWRQAERRRGDRRFGQRRQRHGTVGSPPGSPPVGRQLSTLGRQLRKRCGFGAVGGALVATQVGPIRPQGSAPLAYWRRKKPDLLLWAVAAPIWKTRFLASCQMCWPVALLWSVAKWNVSGTSVVISWLSCVAKAAQPLEAGVELRGVTAAEHRVGVDVEGIGVGDVALERALVVRQRAGDAVHVVDHADEVVAALVELVGGGAEVDEDVVDLGCCASPAHRSGRRCARRGRAGRG